MALRLSGLQDDENTDKKPGNRRVLFLHTLYGFDPEGIQPQLQRLRR